MKGAEIAKCYLINQRKIAQHIAYHIYQKYSSWQECLYMGRRNSYTAGENMY